MKTIAVAMIATLLAAGAANAADPPKVDIRASIAPGTPLDDLSDGDRKEIVAGIRERLLQGCNTHLRFLHWTTGNAAARTHFDATVKPNAVGDLVLVFVGVLDGARFDENFTNSILLYDRYTEVPTDFPKKIKDTVFATVTNGMNNEVFRLRLHAHFFAKIPLSNEPLKVGNAQAVTVPLSRNRMHVGPASKFGVSFSDGAPVSLDLSALDAEDSGQVVCEVTRVKYGGEKDKTGWDDRIKRSFGSPPRARNVKITMADYKLSSNPGTQDGMETRSGNANN
jgi:hypothetical protein